jgi:polar amino acid transport system substrate-binding protein
MRMLKGFAALASAAAFAAACSSGGPSATPSPTPAPSLAPSIAPSVAPSPAPTATPDACAVGSLKTATTGKLTIGTDNPAYPPYYAPRTGGNTQPWDKDGGDPTTGEGFESAVAYAVASHLGFSNDSVVWVVAPFNTVIAPGPKPFDFDINQVTYTAARAQDNDLTDGYYTFSQTVVVLKTGPFAKVTAVSGLKAARLGAQVGTTSLDAISKVIKPTSAASIYDTNDAAIQALESKQIDGVVVDLPTSWYVTGVQAPDTIAIGQLGTAAGGAPEHFSLLLDKGSALTPCLNRALAAIGPAALGALEDKWLPVKTNPVPELQP